MDINIIIRGAAIASLISAACIVLQMKCVLQTCTRRQVAMKSGSAWIANVCDDVLILRSQTGPPPAYIPYLIVGGSFGYLLFMACCIKACTTRDEVVENETGKCVNCQHEIHHAYAPCKVQMPNFHQSCSCYVNCKASVTDLRIRHCGTGCGKTYVMCCIYYSIVQVDNYEHRFQGA